MAFLPLVLSLLFFSCSSTLANIHSPAPAPHHHKHHHHHSSTPAPTPSPAVKPPVHAPAKAPVHTPVKSPAHPPVKSPAYPPAKAPAPLPPRKLVAVQGVVYCKPCKYVGVSTLNGAHALQGAEVKLQCNNTKIGLTQNATTDKNGYFWVSPKKLTTAAFHKCKVFLVKSPSKNCTVATNLHYGTAGAMLIPDTKVPGKGLPFQQFNVGPFAFEPVKNCNY